MVFELFLAAVVAVMLFAGDTSIGRWLHRATVEEPLRFFVRLERKHLLFLVVGVVTIQAFAVALPAELAMALAWDMTIYVDALIATWTLSALARMRLMKARMIRRMVAFFVPVRRHRARVRRRRTRRTVLRKPAANDDDRWPISIAA